MGILTRSFSQIKKEENTIRVKNLVDWINECRISEGITSKLRVNHLNDKIKKYNKVMNEKDMPKIRSISYKDSMNRKQLELRAEVEEKWIEYYRGKKSGIKARIESELI